jgi:hypothetical protein
MRRPPLRWKLAFQNPSCGSPIRLCALLQRIDKGDLALCFRHLYLPPKLPKWAARSLFALCHPAVKSPLADADSGACGVDHVPLSEHPNQFGFGVSPVSFGFRPNLHSAAS